MGDAWIPGAIRLRASADGGAPRGGIPRAVWLTLETNPLVVSARSAAQRADQLGRPPHIVWNPLSGQIVQLIPLLRAGRALGGPDRLGPAEAPLTGEGAPINREGRLCAQIGVVGFAREPFTAGPMIHLERIVWWLDSWHVGRSWPAGPPLPFSHSLGEPRSRRPWARGGHFGASQVPDCCAAAGPGAIDVKRLTDAASVPAVGGTRPARDTLPPYKERLASHAPDPIRPHPPADSERGTTDQHRLRRDLAVQHS